MSFSKYLLKHYHQYPLMRTQDFIKLIYQSEYGAHFGIPYDFSYNFLKSECKSLTAEQGELVEEISPELVRVHLRPYLYEDLDLSVLANMFIHSSLKDTDDIGNLVEKLNEFTDLCKQKKINLQQYSAKATVIKYLQKVTAVSHSYCYKKNYLPAYRVIKKDLWNMYDVITRAEDLCENGTVIFCIDGNSGSGKSYYGKLLADYFGDRCSLFSTDDFFLPISRKTPERLSEIGGNVDYEGLETLLKEIRRGQLIKYNKFSCQTQQYQAFEEMPKQINIVEGVYSAHRSLLKYYDFAVIFTLDEKTQQQRILERDGEEVLARYNNEWLPLENKYLDNLDTSSKTTFTYDFPKLNEELHGK